MTNLERRWRETESEWAREDIARYFTDIPCAACNGYRLKPEALAVKIAAAAHRRGDRAFGARARRWFAELPKHLSAKHNEIASARAQGNPRAADVPGRRRPRLPDAGARLRLAVGRREPAHPARLADRLGPHRRALCARRALDRPAPARQCAAAGNAEAAARSRQHRASSSSTTRTRSAPPTMSSTSGPAPASTAATIVARGHARRSSPSQDSLTGNYLTGERKSPIARAPAGQPRAAAAPSSTRAATI